MQFKLVSFKAAIAAVALGMISSLAVADDRPYTEGAIVNVAGIRTAYGHFDDYLKFLSTTWKAE